MKILFVIKEIDFADHISIPYLSAVAKKLGHETYLCILDKNTLLSMVKKINPDIVAYSVNIVSCEEIIKQHKIVKNKYNFISILGGPYATFYPETFNESGMDVYCVGEGEDAFKDFLICCEKGELYDNIPNLITKNKNNPVRNKIINLDDIPFPDRDITIGNSFLKNTPKKTFYTTRGCPYSCNYCCNNYYNALYKNKGKIIRRFSVDRIIDEIKYVGSKYRMDFIKFGDDLFASKADDWLEEFAEKYSKQIKIPFNCYLRIDKVNDDLLKLLKKSGCFSVHLSIDSASFYVREKILNRKMGDADLIGNLLKIKKYGINTWVNYMLAIPGSRLEDDLDTMDISRKAKVTYSSYCITYPMKGTYLYDYCIDKKFLDPLIYIGDMDVRSRSKLNCFNKKEKNIQYNIYFLGPLSAKVPFPINKILKFLIKYFPPNRLFKKIREIYYNYNITHTIFKIKK